MEIASVAVNRVERSETGRAGEAVGETGVPVDSVRISGSVIGRGTFPAGRAGRVGGSPCSIRRSARINSRSVVVLESFPESIGTGSGVVNCC